jgi:uncharacterized membrane protein YcaP (DUF421 family)
MEELLGIALRISIMYVYTLAILRMAGKRIFEHLSPLDLVIALIVGDLFDDIFWGDIPLSKALVALTTIVVLHILTGWASWRDTRIHHLMNSTETQIVDNGRLLEPALRKERFPEEEALMEIRMLGQSEDELGEIREGYLEPDGRISLLKKEEAKEVQKNDLPAFQELYR